MSVGAALAVLKGVVERGKTFEPPLDTRIVVPHFTDAFKRHVIRNYGNLGAPGSLRDVLRAQTILTASKSSGAQCLSQSRVVWLI